MATHQKTLCITGRRASNTSTGSTNWSSPSSPSRIIDLTLRWWTSNLVSILFVFIPLWCLELWVSDSIVSMTAWVWKPPPSFGALSCFMYIFFSFPFFLVGAFVCHLRWITADSFWRKMFSSLSSGISAYIPCTEGIDKVRLAAEWSGRFRNVVESAAGNVSSAMML